MVYDTNLLRIRFKEEHQASGSFGTIKDLDGTEYSATEIQLHTPAEHTFDGTASDLEVQVIHQSTSGQMRQQAVLSFLFQAEAGAENPALKQWNILNVPNPAQPQVHEFFADDFSVWKFLYP